MSLCINPLCRQPDHPGNSSSQFCQSCGSILMLQNRYRVMRLMSNSSGFGRVYEAYERNEPKVLKVLKEDFAQNTKVIELFQQEASVLSQLHHPGIPRVEADGYFTFTPPGSHQPLHCIVMEKIDGPNLRQWMQQQGNNPIGEKQAIDWLYQLVEVLHLIHHKNYFHRDIKPENIMLRSSGQLVLVDFGAARHVTATYLAQLGQSGGITALSSAGYTPPEQEQGQAVPQSDFYALGRSLIYLLTAKHPTDSGIYNSFSNEFNWRVAAPQISPAFAQLLDRMISPRALDRPQSTQAILDELNTLRTTLSLSQTARQDRAGMALTLAGGSELPQPALNTALQSLLPRRLRSRPGWLPRFVGLAILGLLIALTLNFWHSVQQNNGLLSGSDRASVATETNTVVPLQVLRGHTSPINALLLILGNNQLISASADKTIKVWDLTSGEVLRTLRGHASFVNAIAVSPDAQQLASSSADGEIRLWDLASGEVLQTFSGNTVSVNALVITRDGQQLISGNADGVIQRWDLTTGTLINTWREHTSAINALEVSSNNQRLASASADKTIRLWDLQSGQVRHVLTGHSSFVNALKFSPDGTALISGSADTTLKLWNAETGTLEQSLSGHTSYVNDLVISSDGNLVISAGADRSVNFWDIRTGERLLSTVGYTNHIDHLVVHPQGLIITASTDSPDIEVWELQNDGKD
ncbi:MAG: protein kinase domain-containing protein [Almyronema sp.]